MFLPGNRVQLVGTQFVGTVTQTVSQARNGVGRTLHEVAWDATTLTLWRDTRGLIFYPIPSFVREHEIEPIT